MAGVSRTGRRRPAGRRVSITARLPATSTPHSGSVPAWVWTQNVPTRRDAARAVGEPRAVATASTESRTRGRTTTAEFHAIQGSDGTARPTTTPRQTTVA